MNKYSILLFNYTLKILKQRINAHITHLNRQKCHQIYDIAYVNLNLKKINFKFYFKFKLIVGGDNNRKTTQTTKAAGKQCTTTVPDSSYKSTSYTQI